jgi:hypothetical protein
MGHPAREYGFRWPHKSQHRLGSNNVQTGRYRYHAGNCRTFNDQLPGGGDNHKPVASRTANHPNVPRNRRSHFTVNLSFVTCILAMDPGDAAERDHASS